MNEKILKFEELNERQMVAINRCSMDLFQYYNTCAAPEDWENFRIFIELVSSGTSMDYLKNQSAIHR